MRVNKNRKLGSLILVGAILVALAPVFVSAASKSEIEREKSILMQNIQKNREYIAQKKKEAEDLRQAISQINSDIAATQAKINRTQSQIDKTNSEINDLNSQIAQKENELAIEQKNQDEAIRVMYEVANKNTLEILGGSENLSEVVTYGSYLEALEIKIEKTISAITQLEKDLERQKTELAHRKKDLEVYKAQEEANKNVLNQQLAQKNSLANATNLEIQDYLSKTAAMQKRVADLQKLLDEIYNRGGKGAPVGSQLISSIDSSWYYNQNNYPDVYLGNSGLSVKQAGCLITSIAMVATKYGHYITPPGVVVASYFTDDGGWIGFKQSIGISVGPSQPINWDRVNSELNQGHPVIVSVYVGGPRYNADGSNHFIVITGSSNGKYLIHDPYWTNSSYNISDVISMKIVTP